MLIHYWGIQNVFISIETIDKKTGRAMVFLKTKTIAPPYIKYVVIKIISQAKPNFLISASTVSIPEIPKFSTNKFTTFGDRNAGRVGPR